MADLQLIWLRNDLRSRDNPALHAALAAGPGIALYLLSPGQWQRHDDAPCKIDFNLRNLRSLAAELERLHIPLLVRQVDDWRDVPELLARLCREHAIACVHLNEEYGSNEVRRDQATEERLRRDGIPLRRHVGQTLFRPGSLLTRSGGYFRVFGQFRKACLERLPTALTGPLPAPRAQAPLPLRSDPLPELPAVFPTPAASLRALWPAGEDAAHNRLLEFVEQRLDDYHEQRDLPALPGTSQLSAYLTAGVLSPRQCLHAALLHNRGELSGGAGCWVDELLWREFYRHILAGFPRVSRHRAFRPDTEAVPWRDDPAQLAAWQQGRTGLPLVDAAMRQLLATGWMHNRLRMVTAMFLSKNLLIDWRQGERWFMRHLIDGDLAANNGGWQWSASTGTDAVPYFRLFNPVSQSRRFDPQGRFLRHWLPELAQLDPRIIHEPWKSAGLFDAPDYPPPLVELGASRERALAAFRGL